MGYGRVLLEMDKYREEKEEEEAYAEFMRDVSEYGADWKLANLMGGLAGAAISLITPFNPAFGYLVGSSIGTIDYYSKHKDDPLMHYKDFDELLEDYSPGFKSKFDSGYEGEIDAELIGMEPSWVDPFNMIFENITNNVKMGGDFDILDKGMSWSMEEGFEQAGASSDGGGLWSNFTNQLGIGSPDHGTMGNFTNAAGNAESAMYVVDENGVGQWIFESGEPVAELIRPEGIRTFDMADPTRIDGLTYDWSRYEQGLTAPFSEQLQSYQDSFDEWLATQDADYQDVVQSSQWYSN